MRDRIVPGPNLRALVVEDDTVTREFLVEALAHAGWAVSATATLAVALAELRARAPRLLLCDVRLPDGDAFMLAAALALADPGAKREWYAIALSADVDPALQARLFEAGYHEVLGKPLALRELMASLSLANDHMHLDSCRIGERVAPGVSEAASTHARVHAVVLDDQAALDACGTLSTVQSLRELLAAELPGCLEQLREAHARQDSNAGREILHRLRSASGFCGANALGLAVREACGESIDDPGLARVLREGQALLELLALRRAKQQLAGSQGAVP